MCVCAKSLQACPTLCDTIDGSPPGTSVHWLLQARILEWVAMPSSRGSSWPRDRTCISYVSCVGRQVLNPLAPPGKPRKYLEHFFFSFIFISWKLITLQYCSGFCHTLTWISHGFTYIPHPDPPSHFPLYPIPLGLPSVPGLSTCLMHPTWAGDLFHPR